MAARQEQETLQVGGREIVVTSAGRILFPESGLTKLDLVNYYLAVVDGALRRAGRQACLEPAEKTSANS